MQGIPCLLVPVWYGVLNDTEQIYLYLSIYEEKMPKVMLDKINMFV